MSKRHVESNEVHRSEARSAIFTGLSSRTSSSNGPGIASATTICGGWHVMYPPNLEEPGLTSTAAADTPIY